MTIAHTILRAAHAKGTHHYLALDALKHLSSVDAAAWERLFLKHVAVYVRGSKAPDDEFKDFQNHVLHPRDGYWGGAPSKAQEWYADLVAALESQDWPAAVYAAGVLSHYCLDPLQPLHTCQSEAENNVHAAVEWSINRSYALLHKMAELEYGHLKVTRRASPTWLAELICEGADKATLHYETLLTHYDLKRGVVEPTEGLDYVGQRAVAEMIAHAVRLFAIVLEEAFAEARATPPDVSLTMDVLAAVVAWPREKLAKRARNAAERAEIEAMYDELLTTGQVRAHLAPGEQIVRERYEAEVLANRPKVEVSNIFPLPSRAERKARPAATASASRVLDLKRPAAAGQKQPEPAPPPAQAPAVEHAIGRPPLEQVQLASAVVSAVAHARGADVVPIADRLSTAPARLHLTTEDAIVDAPSIGPRTAEHFIAVGIDTVGDFLKSHPIALADRLQQRGITAETLSAWQDQARLVCTVPGLRGTHAQLLVGAGYTTADALAAADDAKLCADVLTFASGQEGRRLLRDGAPPDLDRIKSWAEAARKVRAA